MSLSRWRCRSWASPAVSLTGSQCGILTNDVHANARIIEVRPFRIQDELEKGRVVIVAGFQGASYRHEVDHARPGRQRHHRGRARRRARRGPLRHLQRRRRRLQRRSAGRRRRAAARLSSATRRCRSSPARAPASSTRRRSSSRVGTESRSTPARTFGGAEPHQGRARRRRPAAERLRELQRARRDRGHRPQGSPARPLRGRGAAATARTTCSKALEDCDVLSSGVEPHRAPPRYRWWRPRTSPTRRASRSSSSRGFARRSRSTAGSARCRRSGSASATRPAALLEALGALSEADIEVVTSFTSREALTCIVKVDEVNDAVQSLHALFLERDEASTDRQRGGGVSEMTETTFERAAAGRPKSDRGSASAGRRPRTARRSTPRRPRRRARAEHRLQLRAAVRPLRLHDRGGGARGRGRRVRDRVPPADRTRTPSSSGRSASHPRMRGRGVARGTPGRAGQAAGVPRRALPRGDGHAHEHGESRGSSTPSLATRHANHEWSDGYPGETFAERATSPRT